MLGSPAPRKNRAATDQAHAVIVPSEIRVSIDACACLRFCQATR
jgi:hypothetical protein